LALFLLVFLRKKKEVFLVETTTSSTSTIATPKSTKQNSKKKTFAKEGEKDPNSYKVRHHAVNAEYIMEGVVNVKIVDVDPSKRAERKKEADDWKTDGKTKSSENLKKTTTSKSSFWVTANGRRRCCPCWSL